MKRLAILIYGIITTAALGAQQTPISENYFMDKYSLAPSYAGNYNARYLITGYRTDWTGIEGGPKTLRFSYNDSFMQNAGYGAKIVYDKAGIFSQLYILGSYSYNLSINEDHHLMFGLSAGIYKNSLNLLDYYNDPTYNLDPSLIAQDVQSKLKFMSDFSAVWTFKGAEAGLLFSNISFGNATYEEVDLAYNPLANFQLHATYLINAAENLDISPLVIVRGGKNIMSQFEIASQLMYLKKFWISFVYRDPGILGFGLGTSFDRGLKIAYNFNLATNVTMGAFNNHEVSIGINLFKIGSKKIVPEQ